jgi:hypothetical protein
LATGLFEVDPGSPFLAEIIINILSETGQYGKAALIAVKYLPLAPAQLKDSFLLKTAIIYHLQRDEAKAKEYAEQIQNTSSLPMADAFRLASLLIDSGDPDAGLQIAYETRNRCYDQYQAHERYIQILTRANQKQEIIFPAQASIDTVIFTKDQDEKELIYFIAKDPSPDPAIILHPDDQLAKIFIGKSIGEECIIENKLGFRSSFRITAIMNKFNFAFWQTLRLFETRFVGQTGFTVFRNDPENPLDTLSKVVQQLSIRGNDFYSQVYLLYTKRKAPIGVVAGLCKHNIAEQWLLFTKSNDVFLYANAINEISDIKGAMDNNKPIVLDIISLLSLFFISQHNDLFEHLPNRLVVAQATVEELLAFSDQLATYKEEGRVSLGFRDGALSGTHTTIEEIHEQHRIVQSIVEWCRQNAETIRPSKLLEINREEREKLTKLFGAPLIETALLAQELNATVVCDDDVFKNFLSTQYGLSTCSTFQWAIYGINIGKITVVEVEQMAFQLTLANHVFIPVSAQTFLKCFEHSEFQVRKPFTVAVKGLLLSNPLHASASVVHFIKKLYLNQGLALTRDQVILYILTELSMHQSFPEIKRTMLMLISNEFRLMPIQAKDFINLLNNF